MSEAILPTHVRSPQDEKHQLPGSYPEPNRPTPKSRTTPKRRDTTLTIDSTAQPYGDFVGENEPLTTSPLAEKVPQSGSPIAPTPKVSTGAKRAAYQRKKRKRQAAAQEGQDAWLKVAEKLEEHDEKMVRGWNEQIDTLLVFAGLFSAVITEFNNEAYQLLLPDPVDESRAILRHMSFQIARIPVAIRSGEPIPELQTPPPFRASLADVAVSTLWYSSLVCALIAASLGMLVKQWLQHYLKDDYSSIRERLRVREARFRGLRNWQVPAIIAFLPLLLRIALTLFLAGLIVFMHSLHPIVMWSVTSLIIVWLLTYSSSLFLPTIFPECPYKAPESLVFYIISRIVEDGPQATWNRFVLGYISWGDPEESVKKDLAEDPNILTTYDRTFADIGLEAEIRECCRSMDEQAVMTCVNRILARRLQIKAADNVWCHPDSRDVERQRRLTRKATDALGNILIDTMERSLNDAAAVTMDEFEWLNGSFSCVTLLLETPLWPMESALDKRIIDLLLKLAENLQVMDSGPRTMDHLYQNCKLFLRDLLRLRPTLFQKELAPALPFLYAIGEDCFLGDANVVDIMKICRAVLSIVVHQDEAVLEKDAEFRSFLDRWETTTELMTLQLASLPTSDRRAVEHDIHGCLAMAENLGDSYNAGRLCMRLARALTENTRLSGSDYAE